MKKLITLVLVFFANTVIAQNMVINGDFEYYSSCPSAGSQTAFCTGWRQYHVATSDYFNVCGSSSGGVKVPNAFMGYQQPASGNAYMGGYAFDPIMNVNYYTEYIAGQMHPLSPGVRYEVSMSVSLANLTSYANNGLGVFFYDNGPTSTLTGVFSTLTLVPQVSYASYGPITDTQNWVRVVGYFTADSAYDNIVIGKFNPPGGLDTLNVRVAGMDSYYYVDSIVVRATNFITTQYADSLVCAGDTFQVPYTLLDNGLYSTGNVFSVQLSNATGSFTSGTTIIGTRTATTAGSISCVVPTSITPGNNYRLRVLSNNRADSSGPNNLNISIGVVRPNISNSNGGAVCTGKSLYLYATSTTSGVSYKWTGPSGFNSVLQNPVIASATVANSGDYIVAAKLYGCISKDTTTAIVSSTVAPLVDAAGSTPICERDTLRLTAVVGVNANSYSWSGPGGFSSISKDTIRTNTVPNFSGDYILTAYYTGCMIKDTVSIFIKPLPANFNAGTNAPICEGNTLFLTGNTSSSSISFSWTGPNSFSSTLQNPNFSPATTNRTGNYILAATLNGCTVQDTVYAQVNPIPSTPTANANMPICVGQDLQLSASTVVGATYNWTSTTGFSSNVQNPVRNSTTTLYAGKYYVTAVANGCISFPDSVIIVVNPAPNITMYPSPKDSICVGQSVTFVSSTSNTGSSFTRNWFRNNNVIGGAANANYSTTTAADGDEYYTTITVYGVCATPYTDTSNIIRMYVLPYLAPSVSITANPNTTVTSGKMINFTATPTNGGNKPGYQWTRNGANITGAISNVWGASTLSNNDQICVDMTSSYLCPNPKTAKSNCIKVSIESTGIVGVWTGAAPSIYPNPATEKLMIEGIEKGTKIQLYDVVGRVVIKEVSTATTTELNLAHLVPGNYVLILSTDAGDRMSVKVVKE